jgi:hypothetical protein
MAGGQPDLIEQAKAEHGASQPFHCWRHLIGVKP